MSEQSMAPRISRVKSFAALPFFESNRRTEIYINHGPAHHCLHLLGRVVPDRMRHDIENTPRDGSTHHTFQWRSIREIYHSTIREIWCTRLLRTCCKTRHPEAHHTRADPACRRHVPHVASLRFRFRLRLQYIHTRRTRFKRSCFHHVWLSIARGSFKGRSGCRVRKFRRRIEGPVFF